MTLWLVNPGAKRKRRDARARFVKRKAATKTRRKAKRAKGAPTGRKTMAARRNAKGRFTKRRATATRRRKRRAPVARAAAPRRRRRRAAAPAKRARRRYRRNPPALKGMVRTLTDGVQNAAAAVVGKAAARAIPAQAGLPTSGPMGIAVQLGAALAVGMVANKVARRHAPFVVAGALMAPIEDAIKSMGIPILSPALAGYYMPAAGARRMVAAGSAGLSSGAGMSSYLQA